MFAMSDLGPMQGQANVFVRFSPTQVPFAIKRYPEITKRHYGVLNGALEGKDYLVGNKYTLADIINYPLARAYNFAGVPNIDDLPNLKAWIARIDARPAVQKGLNVPDGDKVKEFSENPEKLEEYSNLVRAAMVKFVSLTGQEQLP